MRILAIESSCDETAVASLQSAGRILTLEKNNVYSQIKLHKKYGGVVPELAARKHVETLVPIIDSIAAKGELAKYDYIAVTIGPGLVTSLLLGVSLAKTLSYVSGLPLVAVNHMEGHVYSNWLTHLELQKKYEQYFPSLQLIVSGGHTELVLMTGHGKYKLLGQTLDDAVGEAYDKVAKILNLGYPGGPIVSRLAAQGQPAYQFPRPMIDSGDFNFSFSGLKTAVLYTLEAKKKVSAKDVKDICASFQQAAVEVLITKAVRAALAYHVKSIMISGGVSANNLLRQQLSEAAAKIKVPFFYPQLNFTGDNAAMIATAAYYNIKNRPPNILFSAGGKKQKNVLSLKPRANWQLTFKK